ncbi:MAG: choline transporter [Myxococcales bacterium]|nr:choline transporter [Myxococcales bacterium]
MTIDNDHTDKDQTKLDSDESVKKSSLLDTINPPVFFTSGGLLIALLTFSVIAPEQSIAFFNGIKDYILTNFSWFYVLSVTLIFGFCIWLSVSPYGGLVLGEDHEKPVYSRSSWYAMLFAAGMGIGLVFYGVAEPLAHFRSPPVGDALSPEALTSALPLTYHHWGLHAWAVYAVIGLSIAFFTYRRNLPLSIRSCFYPIFGDRIYGWLGHFIDIIAVFGTLFGLATSLGAGAGSVSAGFHRLFDTPDTVGVQLIVIAVITGAATVSLVTGVDKGIKILSEVNMVIAGLLLLFVFLVGPTTYILDRFTEGVGLYFNDFVYRSFKLGQAGTTESNWIKGWSVVYWGWWVAWAPFVGMFVARISRGRTIRDFVLSVMCVPVVVTFFWFAVFGGTALSPELRPNILSTIQQAGSSADAVAVYAMLEQLPFAQILCFLAVIVVTIFFVSSSDSASFVVDMLTSGGHLEPPTWQRVFWATAEGATAAVLLYTGGEKVLSGLKAGVVSFGLPFCFLVLLMCYALFKALKEEDLSNQDNSENSDQDSETTA